MATGPKKTNKSSKSRGKKAKTDRRILRVTLWILGIALCAVMVIVGFSKPYQRRLYPLRFEEQIVACADEFQVDPYLVAAIIKCESGFDEDARSGKGAMGLMQLMPTTADWIAEKLSMPAPDEAQLLTADTNIRLGCWYIKYLLTLYEGDIALAAASYNAGRSRVLSWLEDPAYSDDGKTLKAIPFKETEEYVKRLKNAYEQYQILYQL